MLGRGITIQPEGDEPPTVALRESLVDDNFGAGIFVVGTAAQLDKVRVRGTQPGGSGDVGFGLLVQGATHLDLPTAAAVRDCHFDGNQGAGIGVITGELELSGSLVEHTLGLPDDFLGDGVAVLSAARPSSATIRSSRIDGSARAGVASFGAHIGVGDTVLACNAMDLNGGDAYGFASAFDDLGGNRCACDSPAGDCRLQSADLAPPQPLP